MTYSQKNKSIEIDKLTGNNFKIINNYFEESIEGYKWEHMNSRK